MKNHIKLSFLLIMLAGMMSVNSCKHEPPKEISVTETQLNMPPAGETHTVHVTANVTWNASCSASGWISISPLTGNGNGIVNISCSGNNKGVPQTAVVTITSLEDPNLKAQINISQESLSMKFDKDSLLYTHEGGTQTLHLTCNTDWSFQKNSGLADISISPLKGEGDAIITIKTAPNTVHKVKSGDLVFSYHGNPFTLSYTQEAGPNNPPAIPYLVFPAHAATDVSTFANFQWTTEDPDDDPLTSMLYLSKDGGANWTAFGPLAKNQIILEDEMDVSTSYTWKVVVTDKEGASVSSAEASFTTSALGCYKEGEARCYMKSTKPNPILLVYTGDGYTKDMFSVGGKFDTELDEGIEAFFNVEPYRSYREYFTVWKMAAISQDAGASKPYNNDNRNTAFSTKYTEKGSSGMKCDSKKALDYALQYVPGVKEAGIQNVLVIICVNDQTYGGTCTMYADGSAVAMVPVRRHAHDIGVYHRVLVHECGGHGFGKLADEYVYEEENIPEDEAAGIKAWQTQYATFLNVTFDSKPENAPWATFIGREGYSRVGMWEGACLYRKGVWRCEETNCMIDNRLYFSAMCRYLQVKRILTLAGEEFTLEKFLAKDIEKQPSKEAQTKAPEHFIPLGRPILIE